VDSEPMKPAVETLVSMAIVSAKSTLDFLIPHLPPDDRPSVVEALRAIRAFEIRRDEDRWAKDLKGGAR